MSKLKLSPIERAFRKSLQRYFPDVSSPKFVVAVSAGIDSMSLLYAFKQLGISAVVSHINYQKRGAASHKDAKLVERKAYQWGFECEVAKVNPAGAENRNFQQWAREFRYAHFRQLAQEHDADGIAVAHHEDDQVETILQKIFRGAGLASWSGMQVWDGELFRPLLGVSRSQIEKYAKENEIPYRTDESNLEADFARNLLRNEWLKELSDFFPGWKKNVLRVTEQADNYQHALSWIADRITNNQAIDREAFHLLQPGLQKSLLLFLLKKEDPDLQISRDALDRIKELADMQTGQAIQLAPEVAVLRDRDTYYLDVGPEAEFEPFKLERSRLKDSQLQIDSLVISSTVFENPNFDEALYLDPQKISWPVTIRRWQSGDQIQPLGMQGHQQVSDHLTNRKVSAAHKNKALVIESFEETICAIIFPPIKNQIPPGTISEHVKCDDNTKRCLEIKYRN